MWENSQEKFNHGKIIRAGLSYKTQLTFAVQARERARLMDAPRQFYITLA